MCTSHLRGTTVFFDQNKTSIGAIIFGVMDFKTEKKYQYLLNESGSQPAPEKIIAVIGLLIYQLKS